MRTVEAKAQQLGCKGIKLMSGIERKEVNWK